MKVLAQATQSEGIRKAMSDVEVTHNESLHQYEAPVGGSMAVAQYEKHGNEIVFFHTEVPRALRGRGVGTALIQRALDDARAENLTVVPMCSFVSHYIGQHPEF